nr:glutamate mutase L [Peptoniphilus faecalis]
MERHAGFVKGKYLNGKYINCQEGKDLTEIKYIIGTGVSIVNFINPKDILKSITKSKSKKLIPKKFKLLIDKNYMLSAMGLLSTIDKELALKIMHENLT